MTKIDYADQQLIADLTTVAADYKGPPPGNLALVAAERIEELLVDLQASAVLLKQRTEAWKLVQETTKKRGW